MFNINRQTTKQFINVNYINKARINFVIIDISVVIISYTKYVFDTICRNAKSSINVLNIIN